MGKVIYMSDVCRIEGCANRIHYRGVCRRHYDQMRSSGELKAREEVVAERGYREDHPLYARWGKMKSQGVLAPEWDDFWVFVDAVGEPAMACKLMRLDSTAPFGPGNFRWSIPAKSDDPSLPTCAIEGCGNTKLHARGYCRAHYLRLRKSGALKMNSEVLEARGRKQDHPLYLRWSKMNTAGNLVPEWADFWRFVDDVGETRGRTKMLRHDQTKPMGPDNFYWAEKLTGERKNAYYRNWYKNAPDQRDQRYRRAYGIGIAEYDALLATQGGVCAICKNPETRPVRPGTNEDMRRLSIDHVHLPDGSDGPVRGLLCSACNTSLGGFKDDRAVLIRAIQYLDRHYTEEAA
jgi:hypothetical protein